MTPATTRTAWDVFEALVRAAGLRPRRLSPGHFQIKGGLFLVNYYPGTHKYFVNGANTGVYGTFEDAIKAAREFAGNGVKRAPRKVSYKGHKQRLLRANARCHWCDCALTAKTATIDHLIPLSKGGSNESDNLVLACAPCNERRGNAIAPPLARTKEPA